MINQELFNAIISEVINFNKKVDNWKSKLQGHLVKSRAMI